MLKYTTEPEYAATEYAKCKAAFNAADANGDGFLDAAEYAAFKADMNAY